MSSNPHMEYHDNSLGEKFKLFYKWRPNILGTQIQPQELVLWYPGFPKGQKHLNNIDVNRRVNSATFGEMLILSRAMITMWNNILKLYLKLKCINYIILVQTDSEP